MLLGIILAVAAQASAPLQPTGKWVVEGNGNMCALLHEFGEGGSKIMLGIRPWPIGGQTDILLFTDGMKNGVDRGVEHLAVGAAPALDSPYFRYSLAVRNQRLTTGTYPDSVLQQLETAKELAVSVDRRQPVRIALPDMGPALKALRGCGNLLLNSLRIDPASWARAATAPEPLSDSRNWFSLDDYPPSAVNGGMEGVVHLLLTIGANGRVVRCVPFGGTGNAEMDNAACGGFVRRGQFRPARDASGQPVVGYAYEGVNWKISHN